MNVEGCRRSNLTCSARTHRRKQHRKSRGARLKSLTFVDILCDRSTLAGESCSGSSDSGGFDSDYSCNYRSVRTSVFSGLSTKPIHFDTLVHQDRSKETQPCKFTDEVDRLDAASSEFFPGDLEPLLAVVAASSEGISIHKHDIGSDLVCDRPLDSGDGDHIETNSATQISQHNLQAHDASEDPVAIPLFHSSHWDQNHTGSSSTDNLQMRNGVCQAIDRDNACDQRQQQRQQHEQHHVARSESYSAFKFNPNAAEFKPKYNVGGGSNSNNDKQFVDLHGTSSLQEGDPPVHGLHIDFGGGSCSSERLNHDSLASVCREFANQAQDIQQRLDDEDCLENCEEDGSANSDEILLEGLPPLLHELLDKSAFLREVQLIPAKYDSSTSPEKDLVVAEFCKTLRSCRSSLCKILAEMEVDPCSRVCDLILDPFENIEDMMEVCEYFPYKDLEVLWYAAVQLLKYLTEHELLAPAEESMDAGAAGSSAHWEVAD